MVRCALCLVLAPFAVCVRLCECECERVLKCVWCVVWEVWCVVLMLIASHEQSQGAERLLVDYAASHSPFPVSVVIAPCFSLYSSSAEACRSKHNANFAPELYEW